MSDVLDLLTDARGFEPWSPDGTTAHLRFSDDEFIVGLDFDSAESARRLRAGMRPLTNQRALELLTSMPMGLEVPEDAFSLRDWSVLQKLDGRAVVLGEQGIRRVATPELELLNAGVSDSMWSSGFKRVSVFASYCSRYVLLQEPYRRADLTVPMLEARFYGVGLAVAADGGLDWLVAPAPFRATRFTAASWLMAERVANALEAGAARPTDSRFSR